MIKSNNLKNGKNRFDNEGYRVDKVQSNKDKPVGDAEDKLLIYLAKMAIIPTILMFIIAVAFLHPENILEVIAYFVVPYIISFLYMLYINIDSRAKVVVEYQQMQTTAGLMGVDPDNIVISVSDQGTNVKRRY